MKITNAIATQILSNLKMELDNHFSGHMPDFVVVPDKLFQWMRYACSAMSKYSYCEGVGVYNDRDWKGSNYKIVVSATMFQELTSEWNEELVIYTERVEGIFATENMLVRLRNEAFDKANNDGCEEASKKGRQLNATLDQFFYMLVNIAINDGAIKIED